jgi:hypothetical protein
MINENKWANIADEKIDRYLRGEMSEQEATAFERELRKDSRLADRARLAGLLATTMKDEGEKRDAALIDAVSKLNDDDFREMIQHSGDEGTNKGKAKIRLIYTKRILAACVVLAIIMFGVSKIDFGNASTKMRADLFEQYYKPYNIKGETYDAGSDRINAMGGKSTAMIIEEASTLINKRSKHCVNSGIKMLERLLKLNYKPELEHEIHWYLGFGYLKADRTVKAKMEFEKVIYLKSVHADESRKILNKLK